MFTSPNNRKSWVMFKKVGGVGINPLFVLFCLLPDIFPIPGNNHECRSCAWSFWGENVILHSYTQVGKQEPHLSFPCSLMCRELPLCFFLLLNRMGSCSIPLMYFPQSFPLLSLALDLYFPAFTLWLLLITSFLSPPLYCPVSLPSVSFLSLLTPHGFLSSFLVHFPSDYPSGFIPASSFFSLTSLAWWLRGHPLWVILDKIADSFVKPLIRFIVKLRFNDDIGTASLKRGSDPARF